MPENHKHLQVIGQPPSISYMLAFGLKLIIQIVCQTIFLFFILWMTLFHERWANFRFFMTRNYSPKSLIYLSSFLILFSYIITTLGIGRVRFVKPIFSKDRPNEVLEISLVEFFAYISNIQEKKQRIKSNEYFQILPKDAKWDFYQYSRKNLTIFLVLWPK